MKQSKSRWIIKKGQIKMNNYSNLLLVNVKYLRNHVTITLKWPQMMQIDHYLTLLIVTWHYLRLLNIFLTLFDFEKCIGFAFKTNQLCMLLIWLVYQIKINCQFFSNVFFQLNNSPKFAAGLLLFKIQISAAQLEW